MYMLQVVFSCVWLISVFLTDLMPPFKGFYSNSLRRVLNTCFKFSLVLLTFTNTLIYTSLVPSFASVNKSECNVN